MDPLAQITSSRLVIVAGKGGVGKTTVSAVIARAAARRGRDVLVVELETRPTLAHLLGSADPFPLTPVTLPRGESETGSIRGMTLTPTEALRDYLDTRGLSRLTRRIASTGIIDVIATATPGIDDLVVLGRLKALEREAADGDLIVVDGPAAGHAIAFLRAASVLGRAVTGGPVADQAREVLTFLHDPERCQVVLVTTPETTPVGELIDTAFALEDEVGVQLGPVVVNGIDPGPALDDLGTWDDPEADPSEVGVAREVASWWERRRRSQVQALERLATALPLDRVLLDWQPVAGLRAPEIDRLAAQLDRSDP